MTWSPSVQDLIWSAGSRGSVQQENSCSAEARGALICRNANPSPKSRAPPGWGVIPPRRVFLAFFGLDHGDVADIGRRRRIVGIDARHGRTIAGAIVRRIDIEQAPDRFDVCRHRSRSATASSGLTMARPCRTAGLCPVVVCSRRFCAETWSSAASGASRQQEGVERRN